MRVIAIDGPAGSGKSTIGREVARRLGLEYLDTGAMYRAVSAAVLRGELDPHDVDAVAKIAEQQVIDVGERVTIDGVDVTDEIRGPEVSAIVSIVASNSGVRAALVAQQRRWTEDRDGGVLEGRDIGSVVFPNAELKVYLTASPQVRAERRAAQVGEANEETIAEWAANLSERDRIDSTRQDSPLVEADGAVVVDTSNRTVEDIVEEIVGALT